MARILVVDDEKKLGRLVVDCLREDDHDVVQAAGGDEGLSELARGIFDVVLTDLRMPNVDGLAILEAARAKPNAPDVVVMTAYASTESAVAAMRAGAADYLIKPFALDELRIRVRRLAEARVWLQRTQHLVKQLTPSLIAESASMQSALAAARQVASTDATVLILGETGTGKSELARYIHYQSQRSARPLIEVHCAALAESLLESELFGHVKGAFTGANQARQGHLEAADGGTLFLDEIGELTPAVQVKLLRFLQSREFVRVGSTEAQRVNVRVISATNRDLSQAVAEKSFREDLFYRLNVFSIELPPLSSRREDILPLAYKYLASHGLPPQKLTHAAAEWISQHAWSGNVRELENALERAIILSGESELAPEHFQRRTQGKPKGFNAGDVIGEDFNLDTFEQELIHAAIERAGGNKAAAARLLGISRRRLYSRLESLSQRAPPDDE